MCPEESSDSLMSSKAAIVKCPLLKLGDLSHATLTRHGLVLYTRISNEFTKVEDWGLLVKVEGLEQFTLETTWPSGQGSCRQVGVVDFCNPCPAPSGQMNKGWLKPGRKAYIFNKDMELILSHLQSPKTTGYRQQIAGLNHFFIPSTYFHQVCPRYKVLY